MRDCKSNEPLTLERLLKDDDWRQSFGESIKIGPDHWRHSGNGDGEQLWHAENVLDKCDPCPLDSDVDLTVPTRVDVAEIIAAVDGENDTDNWLGVFLLKDGRYLLVDSWCDYTGWD